MIKVTVNINGMDYNLKGDKNEQYLVDLADFVDSKVKEIMSKNSRLSTSAATVLAAVNIADELYECDSNLRNAINKKKNIETEKSELIQKVDKLNEDLKTTLVEKTKLQEQLVNGEQSLKEKYLEIEETLTNLKEEATNLEKEKGLLLEKNNKLENNLKEISNLNEVLNKEVVEIKEKNKFLYKKVDESKGKEVELRNKLQVSSGNVKELENKVSFLENKCTNLGKKFDDLNTLNTENSLELERMIKVRASLEEENSILIEKSKSLEDNCLTLQSKIEELTLLISNEKSNKRVLQEEYTKCKEELENISDLYYETDKEVTIFKQKIEEVNRENEKLNSKINVEIKNKKILEDNIQKLNNNINSINNEKNKIKQENLKVNEELTSLRDKYSKLIVNEDNSKKTINIKHKEIEELRDDLSNKDKSLIDIKNILECKEKSLEKLKDNLDEKEKNLEVLKNTLSKKDASVVELENKVEELNKHKSKLMERSKTVNNNLRTSKYKVMELKDKLLNVEIELAALKSQQFLNGKTKKVIGPLSHKK
ncbi:MULTISPECIES: cell division protein ZapA [Clostridium]|uniref:Cell division protein ZapA n=1 Tax=Clostridium aquiflavi TaxID=3073603 RepID=A0ABU1EFI2_9CLOT|nr:MULTISPECIES: cell division protein ZapA [unclassified Clostridium]MDR5586719.1 cell division protein ZapA [Clostridium sp. 5N-1]NFG62113.1 cell division protein ZapA [Clostridium botulinum]NFQ09647.1 cell division protein ZapA [Clostridium botulinum]